MHSVACDTRSNFQTGYRLCRSSQTHTYWVKFRFQPKPPAPMHSHDNSTRQSTTAGQTRINPKKVWHARPSVSSSSFSTESRLYVLRLQDFDRKDLSSMSAVISAASVRRDGASLSCVNVWVDTDHHLKMRTLGWPCVVWFAKMDLSWNVARRFVKASHGKQQSVHIVVSLCVWCLTGMFVMIFDVDCTSWLF